VRLQGYAAKIIIKYWLSKQFLKIVTGYIDINTTLLSLGSCHHEPFLFPNESSLLEFSWAMSRPTVFYNDKNFSAGSTIKYGKHIDEK